MNLSRPSVIFLLVVASTALSACVLTAGGQYADASTAVYSRGARQHTVSVIMPHETGSVFAAINDFVDNDPEINVLARNTAARMVEITRNDVLYNFQATDIDNDRTLLFVWIDTGQTGAPPDTLALNAVKRICGDFGISCRIIDR